MLLWNVYGQEANMQEMQIEVFSICNFLYDIDYVTIKTKTRGVLLQMIGSLLLKQAIMSLQHVILFILGLWNHDVKRLCIRLYNSYMLQQK
jgi:hypothetical protein